jgi:hypothetical protein
MPRFSRFPDNLDPEDRRVYWRWVASVLAAYGVVLIVTIGTVVANNWPGRPADQLAAAKPAGEKMQAVTAAAPAPAKHPTKNH